MEIKRFDSMFEAAKKGAPKKPAAKKEVVKKTAEEKEAVKASKGNLKKELHDYLVDKLKKKKMSRSCMLDVLISKFGDDKNTETAIENAVDDIMHEPMKTKLNVQSDKFKGGVKSDAKRYYPYFFIGDESKDPSGVEKEEKSEPKERGEVTKKGKKVENFADFKGKKDKEEKEEKEEGSDKPKFGSAEWREMYSKGKKDKEEKEEKEPKKEDKKEKKDKPVKESRIPKFDKF